jgi:hypothetical protein
MHILYLLLQVLKHSILLVHLMTLAKTVSSVSDKLSCLLVPSIEELLVTIV